MKDMPHGGGTFGSARVSEAGRQFLARLLNQLTEAQIAELFAGARFDRRPTRSVMAPLGLRDASGPRPIADWVRVFKLRQQQITDGPACPGA
jgi:hypothetical protein